MLTANSFGDHRVKRWTTFFLLEDPDGLQNVVVILMVVDILDGLYYQKFILVVGGVVLNIDLANMRIELNLIMLVTILWIHEFDNLSFIVAVKRVVSGGDVFLVLSNASQSLRIQSISVHMLFFFFLPFYNLVEYWLEVDLVLVNLALLK